MNPYNNGLQGILFSLFTNGSNPCIDSGGNNSFSINSNLCMDNNYYNVNTKTYEPFIESLGSNQVGVFIPSLGPAVCECSDGGCSPPAYLPPPFTDVNNNPIQGTNVEFFYSPPPDTNCSAFPLGPYDCANCTSGMCSPSGLQCSPNGAFEISPVGPCIQTLDGGSIQGWECVQGSYEALAGKYCDYCYFFPNNSGTYSSLEDCVTLGLGNVSSDYLCNNNGTCGLGHCVCKEGFTGNTCNSPSSVKKETIPLKNAKYHKSFELNCTNNVTDKTNFFTKKF